MYTSPFFEKQMGGLVFILKQLNFLKYSHVKVLQGGNIMGNIVNLFFELANYSSWGYKITEAS